MLADLMVWVFMAAIFVQFWSSSIFAPELLRAWRSIDPVELKFWSIWVKFLDIDVKVKVMVVMMDMMVNNNSWLIKFLVWTLTFSMILWLLQILWLIVVTHLPIRYLTLIVIFLSVSRLNWCFTHNLLLPIK